MSRSANCFLPDVRRELSTRRRHFFFRRRPQKKRAEGKSPRIYSSTNQRLYWRARCSCFFIAAAPATIAGSIRQLVALYTQRRRTSNNMVDEATTRRSTHCHPPPPSPASLVIREPGGAYNKRSTKYRSTKRTSLSFSLYSRLSSERYATGHTQKGTPHTHKHTRLRRWRTEMIPHSKARDGNFFKQRKGRNPNDAIDRKKRRKHDDNFFFSRNQREEKERSQVFLKIIFRFECFDYCKWGRKRKIQSG